MKTLFSKLSLLISIFSFVTFGQSPDPSRVSSKLEPNLSHERDLQQNLDRKEISGWPAMFEETHRVKKSRTISESGMYMLLSLVGDTVRFNYTHDNQGKILTRLEEVKSNNVWINKSRNTYAYDNNGNQLIWLLERWQNGAWVNYTRNTYTYDNNGNQLIWLLERWRNDAWEIYDRYTYTYDNNGNQLSSLEEWWQNGAWVNFFRYTYTYDNNGNQLSRFEEIWQNGAWLNFFTHTYTYDNNGNQLTGLIKRWQNGAWVNSSRYTYTYDNNGNQLSRLEEHWPSVSWVNSGKSTYTYDANGNLLTVLGERWTSSEWVNYDRYTCSYDSFNNTTSVNYYRWQNNSWVLSLATLDFYYNNKQDYASIQSSTSTATYQYITGIESESPEGMDYSLSQNYPNPFNPETVIRYALPVAGDVSIVVYNSLGQELAALVDGYTEAGKHTVTFDASKLTSGVYFYRLTTEKGSIYKKMTLLK